MGAGAQFFCVQVFMLRGNQGPIENDFGVNSEELIKNLHYSLPIIVEFTVLGLNLMESLILAQSDRWRRA